ncbi:MAG: radical SAM protein [Deltaproteobacteria bacterium]|nr:radical SAM protein [Deltaproteobacteria bacterium]
MSAPPSREGAVDLARRERGLQAHSPHRDTRKNVEINIGKTCNNKCVFCLDGMPTREDKAFMPFDDMKAELERWRAEGHLSVGFLGGEPTTYPFIVESVAYARELGYTRIALATNAMMLRREHFLDKLIDAGLNRVTVSMHGHTAPLEDRLTMVPGGFEKKVTALRHLVARRDRGLMTEGVSVNIVLNGWNYRALPKMMKFFFQTMDLHDLRVNFVRPEGYAEGNPDLVPTFTDTIPVLVKAILLNEYHFRRVFTFGGLPLCVLPAKLLGSETLLRKYAGDLYRDLSTDCSVRAEQHVPVEVMEGVSRVEGGRARFNWQDRKRFDLKHHIEACQRCDAADVCEGVWRGYRDIYGDREVAPLTWESGAAKRLSPRVEQAPEPAQVARSSHRRRLVVLS